MIKQTVLLLLLILFTLFNNTLAQRYWNVAAKFEGNSSSLIRVIPYSSLQNINGSFSVECWFYCDPGGYGTLFGKNGFRLLLDPAGDKMRGRMQTNNNTKLYTRLSTAMETKKWYHLACTYNNTTGLMSFYINGSLDTSITGSSIGPSAGTDSVLIGTSVYGSFKGMIDDIRVWNRTLSASEIANNMRNPYVGAMNNNTSNFGTGLVMSASFDFTYSGSSSLYFYDGYNNYINQGASGLSIGDHPSQTIGVNYALDLTNGGYAKMPSNADIEFTGPVTAEAWIYPINSATGSTQYILRKGNDYNFYLDGTGKIRFVFNAVGTSIQTIPSNKWTHIAITCNQTGLGKIYVNGNYEIAYNFGSRPTAGTDTLFIGAYSYNQHFFNGYIDAVKISNYEKTEEQIKQDMFRIIDFGNRPQPPNSTVSLNFDYNDYSSTSNGGYYYLRGNAKYTTLSTGVNVPISPIIGNNVQFFPNGYFYKYSGKRIPQTNTAGYMEEDSLEVTTSSAISNMQLYIAINHAQLTDLQIYLHSPSGDSVLVWNGNYGINQSIKYLITIFNDNADSSILNGRYVDFGPTIKPYSSLSSAFSGKNPQGIWKLKIVDLFNGNIGFLYAWGLRINNSTGDVDNLSDLMPTEFAIEQNFPNPFNPTTKIKYQIHTASHVILKIFDILGKEIKTLVSEEKQAGYYNVEFDGSRLSSGVYFCRLITKDFSKTIKMLLTK